MMSSFPYVAMTITGVFHVIFGLTIFINACVGLSMDVNYIGLHYQYNTYQLNQILLEGMRIYLGVVVGSSLWIIMVGILGILTGIKSMEHRKTHGLKIGYMVTAILSAVIFSLTGLSLSAVVTPGFKSIGIVGALASFADFILSIVSSSICCCCASSTTTTTNVVFVQGQAPPGSYPTGTPQPGAYPPGAYPPGAYPPGAYPSPYPAGYSYPVAQSPQEGVVNPGYQLNLENQTKNEVA